MAGDSNKFQLWMSIEVEDSESMTKKDWTHYIAHQMPALQKHIAKCLHVSKVKVNLGHIELK